MLVYSLCLSSPLGRDSPTEGNGTDHREGPFQTHSEKMNELSFLFLFSFSQSSDNSLKNE